jgi:Cof subfamily protein (haloacid dehalogenase superfamily)
MTHRIRLLAIDIDGTLLDSQFNLSEANRAAVVAAHRHGAEVVLVTGRRFSFTQPVAAQFPIELTIIASNGALVKSPQGTTLARQLLPRAQARGVLATADAYRDNALLLFDREGMGQIVAERLDLAHTPVERYVERNREYLQQVKRLEDALTDDPIQVLFMGAVEPMRELYQQLREAPCTPAVTLARTEYVERDLTLLDVLARGCNKGAALARLAARRGIAAKETMAIGDNWNDWEMLEFAGLPVLMANSAEELKQKGWAVTGSNDESGVAAAIEKYLLSSPAP